MEGILEYLELDMAILGEWEVMKDDIPEKSVN